MIWWQQVIGHLVIISKCAIRSFCERCTSVPHLRRSCHWPYHPLLLHPSWQVCNDFLAKLNLKLHLSIYKLFGIHKDISEYRPIYGNLVGLTSVCWIIDSQVVPRQWLGLENPPGSHRSTCLLTCLPPPHSLPLGQAQGWRSWRLFAIESKGKTW